MAVLRLFDILEILALLLAATLQTRHQRPRLRDRHARDANAADDQDRRHFAVGVARRRHVAKCGSTLGKIVCTDRAYIAMEAHGTKWQVRNTGAKSQSAHNARV